MWIPGPDMILPTEYRREGIRIGDVGILYRSEGFSFLFNIFLSADHPINDGRVPPGFEPLDLSNLKHGPKKQVVFGPKSYLTSTSVATSSNVDSSYVSDSITLEVLMVIFSSNLIFETSATEGAVIIMPNGAITEDLMCRKSIKKYLAKNAETWYEFVSEVCELDIDNGDIRLVASTRSPAGGLPLLAAWENGFASNSRTSVTSRRRTHGIVSAVEVEESGHAIKRCRVSSAYRKGTDHHLFKISVYFSAH